MEDDRIAKYALAAGFVLTLVGVGMMAVPSLRAAASSAVDSSPPHISTMRPPEDSTKESPRKISRDPDIEHFGYLYVTDSSGVDESTFAITCTDETTGKVVYSKSGLSSFSDTFDTGRVAWAGEYLRDYYPNGLPRGHKFKFEMSVKDKAGNELEATGWYLVEAGAPSGKWYINGTPMDRVSTVENNEVTWQFVKGEGVGTLRYVAVEIRTRKNEEVKTLDMTKTGADVWEGTCTLSDGLYTAVGKVDGTILMRKDFGVNTRAPNYGAWLAFGTVGAGLLSMLGGAWKLVA